MKIKKKIVVVECGVDTEIPFVDPIEKWMNEEGKNATVIRIDQRYSFTEVENHYANNPKYLDKELYDIIHLEG